MNAATVLLGNPKGVHKPAGYSHVAQIRDARLIYIAGQVAQDADSQLVGKDDFRAQLQQVFANIKSAVESAGASCADIIKLNYFCCDRVPATELPIVREIRDKYVNTASPPVSTFVFVSRLVRPDWLIEIEAVAAVRDET